MRRLLLVVIVLLAALLVVGDFALRSVAENRIASAAFATLDLDRRPDVDIGGFPFLFRLARGQLPSVTLAADRVTRESVVLRDVEVMFRNVRFSIGELVAREDRAIQLGPGRGVASMTSGDATAAAQARGAPVDIEFNPGAVTVISEDLGVEASARLAVNGSDLVIDPDGDIPPVTVPLPELAPGVRYRSVRVEEGRAVLQVRMEPLTLRF
jgi:hypothetical protein